MHLHLLPLFFHKLSCLPLYCFLLCQNTVADFSICVFCSLVQGEIILILLHQGRSTAKVCSTSGTCPCTVGCCAKAAKWQKTPILCMNWLALSLGRDRERRVVRISLFFQPVTAHPFHCQMNPEASTGEINTTDRASLTSQWTTDRRVSPVLVAELFSQHLHWAGCERGAVWAPRGPAGPSRTLAAPEAIPRLWQDMKNVSSLAHDSKHNPLGWFWCSHQP